MQLCAKTSLFSGFKEFNMTTPDITNIMDQYDSLISKSFDVIAKFRAQAQQGIDQIEYAISIIDKQSSLCNQLNDQVVSLQNENDQLRADLQEAIELLRAHGQPRDWITRGDAADWNFRYGKLLAKHKKVSRG